MVRPDYPQHRKLSPLATDGPPTKLLSLDVLRTFNAHAVTIVLAIYRMLDYIATLTDLQKVVERAAMIGMNNDDARS